MFPFAITGAVEGVAFLGRLITRQDYWNRARARANDLQRPLVVVGAPSGGLVGNYECGDLCVDLQGCEECGAKPSDVQRVGGIPLGKDSAVVFVSYTLEYCDDIDAAWREVERVGGSTDNIFVAHVQPWATWTHVFYPGSKWMVLEAPPKSKQFRRRPICRKPINPDDLLVHR